MNRLRRPPSHKATRDAQTPNRSRPTSIQILKTRTLDRMNGRSARRARKSKRIAPSDVGSRKPSVRRPLPSMRTASPASTLSPCCKPQAASIIPCPCQPPQILHCSVPLGRDRLDASATSPAGSDTREHAPVCSGILRPPIVPPPPAYTNRRARARMKTQAREHVHTHARARSHTNTRAHTRAHIRAHTHTHLHTQASAHTRKHIREHKHTHKHARTRTHTHTHMRAHTNPRWDNHTRAHMTRRSARAHARILARASAHAHAH